MPLKSSREENRAKLRSVRSTSCDRRSNCALRHPGISFQWERPARVNSVLSFCLSRNRRVSTPHPSRFVTRTLVGRSNAYLHHTGNFCGGNRRPKKCSTSGLQHCCWRDSNPRPMYLVPSPRRKLFRSSFVRQILRSCLPARFGGAAASCTHENAAPRTFAHTRSVYPPTSLRSAEVRAEKSSGRNQRSRFFGTRTRAFRPFQTKYP